MSGAELTVARIEAWSEQGDPAALALLCRAMTDDNPVLAQHAKQALQRHPSPHIGTVLAECLTDPHEGLARFAITAVTRARMVAVVPRLLDHFRQGASPALRHVILRGLALLPDPRVAPFLLPLLRERDEPTQYLALRVYAVLLQQRLTRSLAPLIALCTSPSARIRQTAVWALPQPPTRRLQRLLRTMARDDPDPLVRIAALRGLCRRWSVTQLQFVLARLINEPDHTVRLQIEGLLQQIPPPLLQRSVRRLLRARQIPSLLKAHGVRLLVHQADIPHWCGAALLDLLTHSSDEQIRLLLLPALGQLRTPATWTYLHALVRGHTVESYSALLALLEHPATWHPETFAALLAVIWDSPLLLQSVLKLAHRRAPAVPWPAACLSQLLRALAYPNSNVRYLAAHLLARLQPAELLPDFLRIALAADDLHYPLYRDALALWLTAPAALTQIGELLAAGTVTPPMQERLLGVLRVADMAPADIVKLVPQLCDPRHALLNHTRAPLLALLHHWLTSGRLDFDTVLAALPDDSAQSTFFGALVDWWGTHPPGGAPDPTPLRARLGTAPHALQSLLLQLLSFLPDAPIVPDALDLLDTTRDASLRARTCQALLQWCRGPEAGDA